MTTRAKQLWVVILTQTGCVAVGLWMEHQYVQSSVRRAAEEKVRSDIESFANDLRSELSTEAVHSLSLGSPALDRARGRLAAKHPRRGGAMIVDREWQVVVQAGSDQVQIPRLEAGQRVSWTPSAEPSEETAFALWGTLQLPDGPHLARAVTLDGSAGFVIVHRAAADIAAESAALVTSLPALSGITLLWMCALLATVVYLILTRFHDAVDCERKRAGAETLRRTRNLERTRDAVIFGLAKLADSRDPETGDHLDRISIYSTMLASVLRREPRFCDTVTPAFVKLIGISSALHDIGKVGIEDRILRKSSRLTSEERAVMQTHSKIGGECLREIEQRLGSSNFLQMARGIAFAHHERWDGTGYPNRLSGEAIPLAARIVAIADVYDALSSKRVYKPALPHEECVAVIRSHAGKRFDPNLVEVWLKIEPKFRETALRYGSAIPDSEETCSPTDSGETEQEHLGGLVASSAVADQ